jgi:hypothetical protein
MAKITGTSGACLGRKRPENGRQTIQKAIEAGKRHEYYKFQTHPQWPEMPLLLI